MAGEKKRSGALHVDAGGGGGGQGAMPEVDEFPAAGVAGSRIFKNFFRFEIEEAQAHGAVPMIPSRWPTPPQPQKFSLGSRVTTDVAALPDSFA